MAKRWIGFVHDENGEGVWLDPDCIVGVWRRRDHVGAEWRTMLLLSPGAELQIRDEYRDVLRRLQILDEGRIPYAPDGISPPGATIADLLEMRGMTLSRLAKDLKMSRDVATQLLEGKVALTPELAERLERLLGPPAEYWMTHEMNYRESLRRKWGHV